MLRWLFRSLAAIVVLILAVAFGLYAYGRQSLPAVNGTVIVSGVSAPIEIIRDADAIPHIFAKSKNDALFG
ncbi:MAG TPA: hypothetical protein VKH42_13120, partial [Vicinamibacterales bacterium]|nr:hypothetical protein [Vicinamibacterales bacterium]